MKTPYNRFAIIPFHCPYCHNYIWLEKYRRAEIDTGLPQPAFIKSNICKDCIKRFDVKGDWDRK